MELLDSHGNPIPRGKRGGNRGHISTNLRLRISRAALQEIGDHIEAGTAAPSHLMPLAVAALGDVLWYGRKGRDLTGAANVVRQWMADQDEPPAGSVTAIQVILPPSLPPAPTELDVNGHQNGHADPR